MAETWSNPEPGFERTSAPRSPSEAGGAIERRMEEHLLERRTVLLRGTLDDGLASRVAAQLMWLDGTGDEAVSLHVDSPGGSLHTAFTLVDAIDLLGVPVHALCMGRVEGSAIGVVAACDRRSATLHTQFHLVEPRGEASGRAAELERWAAQRQSELASFVARLAEATGRPTEHLEADLVAGRWMDAEAAIAYGLIHDITAHGRRSPRPPGSAPMGYKAPQ